MCLQSVCIEPLRHWCDADEWPNPSSAISGIFLIYDSKIESRYVSFCQQFVTPEVQNSNNFKGLSKNSKQHPLYLTRCSCINKSQTGVSKPYYCWSAVAKTATTVLRSVPESNVTDEPLSLWDVPITCFWGSPQLSLSSVAPVATRFKCFAAPK